MLELTNEQRQLTVLYLIFSNSEYLMLLDPYHLLGVLIDGDIGLGWSSSFSTAWTTGTPPPQINLQTFDIATDFNDDYDVWKMSYYPEFQIGFATAIGWHFDDTASVDFALGLSALYNLIIQNYMWEYQLKHQSVEFIDQTAVPVEQPNDYEVSMVTVIDYRPKNWFLWDENGKILGRYVQSKEIKRAYFDIDREVVNVSERNLTDAFVIANNTVKIYSDIKVACLNNVKYVVKVDFTKISERFMRSDEFEIIAMLENWILENLNPKLEEKISSELNWPSGQISTEYMFNVGHFVPNYLLIDYKLTERTAAKFGYGLIICRVTNQSRNPVWLTKSRMYALNNIVVIPDWLAFARKDYMPVDPMLVCDEVVSYMKQFIHPLDFIWILDPKFDKYYWYKYKEDYLRNDQSPLGLTGYMYDSPLSIGENDTFCVLPILYNADAVTVAGMAAYAAMHVRPNTEYKKDFTKGANYYV